MAGQLELFEIEKDLSKDSVLKYVGGKYFWCDDIIKFIPHQYDECVSPFIGGGHLEMLMSSRGFTMHCGDIYKPLVYAWQVLLNCPELIAERVEKYEPTRDNNIEIRRAFFEAEEKDEDWREIGVLFYLAIRVSYNGIIGKRTPTGSLQGADANGKMRPMRMADRVRAFHAPKMSVELIDYRKLLSRHPEMLSYMDPPYKIPFNLYGSDGETHESFDHEEYADFVLSRPGPFIISYNDDEWIRDRYRECELVNITGRYTNHGKSKVVSELLIIKGIEKEHIEFAKSNIESCAGPAPQIHANMPNLFEVGEEDGEDSETGDES